MLSVNYLKLDIYREANPEENWFSLPHKALIAHSSSRMGRPPEVYPIHIGMPSGISIVQFLFRWAHFGDYMCAASLSYISQYLTHRTVNILVLWLLQSSIPLPQFCLFLRHVTRVFSKYLFKLKFPVVSV